MSFSSGTPSCKKNLLIYRFALDERETINQQVRFRRCCQMETINAKSIFSPATGFIKRGGFDWTCNPYVGCSFGCVYCYALFLPQNRRPREDWGKWFQAKSNAVELAHKQAAKVAGQAIYLSSVTDPYLPAE